MKYHKILSLESLTEEVNGVLCQEKWLDIIRYEGYYQVSDFGRIKSLMRIINTSNGRSFTVSEKIRMQGVDKDGYLMVVLSINQNKQSFKVHRLVGIHFLENPESLPEINHKKGIKYDNRVHQLEWVTALENTRHAFRELGVKSGRKGKFGSMSTLSKKVYCPTLGISFSSAAEAERELCLVGVGEVCNGNLIHAKGLSFRYV